MARRNDRQKAIELRVQGNTYSAIKQLLGISKSTLSDWLSKYPLNEEQLALVSNNDTRHKEAAIEKYRMTMRLKREARLNKVYKSEQEYFLPLTERELLIAGLFLYWGEGSKYMKGALSINNTDPQVMKFTLYWITSGLSIPRSKVRVQLHLYQDMNILNAMEYWHTTLKIPLSQFSKPYIKNSQRSELDQKGYGHGTCTLVVNDILLKEKVMMGIKSIADHYSQKIEAMI